jgi:DNA-binding winged helix-turn-helix (wHTH) protein
MSEQRVFIGEFELDFGRFQLYRNGSVVPLEGLPLQLLMLLVENKGQLVTRKNIADSLWGREVFVDVEQGINTAIRKIRMALDDDAERPQYLQTVVGRGYRFVTPVTAAEKKDGGAIGEGAPFTISPEELGQAIMAAAGLDPSDSKPRPKNPGSAAEQDVQRKASR